MLVCLQQQMIKKSQQTIDYVQSEAIQALKCRTKSRVSSTIDPIDYQKSGLFFIKSKHAFKEYKNHDYFESQRCFDDKIDNHRSTEFVESPPPYGINNAYCFMRDEISKNYLKKNHHPSPFKTISSLNTRYGMQKKEKKQQSKKRKRNINLTLPNLNELQSQSIIFRPSKTNKLRSSHELQLKQTGLPLKTSHETRTAEASKLQAKPNSKQYSITVIYTNKFQSIDNFGSIEIKINIYAYIMKTFLKTKINYVDLSSDQFNFLVNKIVDIYQSERETITYKDIINCKTTQQVFQVLMQYSEASSQFKEIIRYFFVANQDVYTYQFDCIKDQIRFLINQETNSINNNQRIYVYDIRTGVLIANLQQLIKYNKDKFVTGITQNVYEIYQMYNREKKSKKEAEERIRKWKSIVPNQTHGEAEFHHVSSEKYQTLFDNVQKKRFCLYRSKKKPSISIKGPTFIDRDKLVKFQNIFQ